jgi:hypothetical protein
VVFVSQLHLGPLAPDCRQVVDLHEGDVGGLFEDDPGVVDLLVGLVKLGEVDPQKLELADGLLRVDGLAEASKNFLFAAAKWKPTNLTSANIDI